MAIQIKDEAGLLKAEDLPTLQTAAGKWPFDVHVITATDSPTKAAFEARVSSAVTSPNVVAIGVDPTHHWTFVHYGKETGVPASQWSSIYTAGTPSFKENRWADGLIKIADRATNARQQAQTVTVQPDRPGTSTDHTGLWIFGGIVVVACVVGLYYWWKAKKQAEERQRLIDLETDQAAERAANNREVRDWHRKYKSREEEQESSPPPAPAPRATYARPAPVYSPPVAAAAPSTVVVNQTTTAPSGGGGDMLTGYMLGRMDSPRVVEREVIIEERPRHRHYDPAPSYNNDDAGGGGGSWGTTSTPADAGGGGGGWSSNDAGGGGTDYGSSDTSSTDTSSSDAGGGGGSWE